jgi:hypothetical protein
VFLYRASKGDSPLTQHTPAIIHRASVYCSPLSSAIRPRKKWAGNRWWKRKRMIRSTKWSESSHRGSDPGRSQGRASSCVYQIKEMLCLVPSGSVASHSKRISTSTDTIPPRAGTQSAEPEYHTHKREYSHERFTLWFKHHRSRSPATQNQSDRQPTKPI